MTDIRVNTLTDEQSDAVNPQDQIWLSASAGTGKTQVLTARVIRLLLEENAAPESLLCITFTKAGAAEMAGRINTKLAEWVQMESDQLSLELQAIGARFTPDHRARARQLFAKVLDAPSRGLRIMTIHSLCQSLLASFPEEAGLLPGFQPLEGREEVVVKQQVLSEMILAARNDNHHWVIENLQQLSLDLGEEAALKFLTNCAKSPDVMDRVPEDKGAIIFARRLLGITFEGSAEVYVMANIADSVIARPDIEAVASMNEAWGKKADSRGGKRAAVIRDWLQKSAYDRAESFEDLHYCWTKSNGDPLTDSRGYTPTDPSYAGMAQSLHEWTKGVVEQISLITYAERLAAGFQVGKLYSEHYIAAKKSRGVLDFDDLIRKAATMLKQSEMTEWIRYKLDQRIDHILIDEAQDTNKDQWDIVRKLSDDFFSGLGSKEDKNRTIFAVGDYKQAIFGFQGTDPETYTDAEVKFDEDIRQAGGELLKVELSQSFRSSPVVLDFVNAVIEETGASEMGVADDIGQHVSEKQDYGCVELLSLVTPIAGQLSDNDSEGSFESEENWLSGEKRRLAYRIAHYVHKLYVERPMLASTGKRLGAGDVMILLRRRSDLASAIVSQLHSMGVPVAGIDRMKIREPIVVKDILAVIRFALQPDDDLNLAALLVSPLFGWSQEKLLQFGYRPKRMRLWRHLRDQEAIAEDIRPLRSILAQSDYVSVYQFIESILSGEMAGRAKLTGRLGREALVPIEELLNKALEYEQSEGGSLQAFLAWFEQGETEIKREGDTGEDAVRVMTVHGAKGLQAPIVILADIAADPAKKPDRSVSTNKPFGTPMPLLPINKSMRVGRLDEFVEGQEAKEQAEHLRLLYVAITRAEERLVLAGSMSSKTAPERSWYPKIEAAMMAMGAEWVPNDKWGVGGSSMRVVGKLGLVKEDVSAKLGDEAELANARLPLPDWLKTLPPQEVMPPRPLAPTRIDNDQYGEAPASPELLLAAKRGKLIHSLLERMTGAEPEMLLHNARRWLLRNNNDTQINNDAMLSDIEDILKQPDFAGIFGPNAKAEVPIAAVVGKQVVSGRIDRLIIDEDSIRIIDFKTGYKIPQNLEDISVPYIRQMAYYAAALRVIFGDKKIECALLYTHGPKLFELPDDLLSQHKPE
jgi:ATP-dependent helicase/nuclease subunit A